MMRQSLLQPLAGRTGAWGLAMMAFALPVPAAYGAMLSTESIVGPAETSRERLTHIIDRQEVKQQLMAMGVSPTSVERRLASLSDEEVQTLNAKMAVLPAGGDSTVTISIGAAIIIALLLIIFL